MAAPEVIDLLSSSPEPEDGAKSGRIVRKVKRKSKGKGKSPERRKNKLAAGIGRSASDVEWSGSFADGSITSAPTGKEIGLKEVENNREMTEAEKIRELRMKRFGGLSGRSSGVGSEDAWAEQDVPRETKVKEANSEARRDTHGEGKANHMARAFQAVNESGINTRNNGAPAKEPELPKSTPTFHSPLGATMMNLVDDPDDWGGIDLTQDDDDFSGFDMRNKSREDDGWKSTAFKDTRISHGPRDMTARMVDSSDPFRSSSPVEAPRMSNDKLSTFATGSRGSNAALKARSKDIGTKTTDYSDPFRSSSPAEVHSRPRVQSSKPTARPKASIEEKFSFMDDKFGTSGNFDDSYEFEVPVAKRQRVSPTPGNTSSSMTSGSASRAMTKETGGYRRTVSAVAKSTSDFKTKASSLRRSKTMNSDPIAFTSSPDPFDYKNKKAEKRKGRVDDDDFLDIDDIGQKEMPSVSARPIVGVAGCSKSKSNDWDMIVSDDDDNVSDNSDALFPEIANITANKLTTSKSTAKSRDTSASVVPSPTRPKPKSSKSALAAYEKEKAAEKKAQEKAAKAAEKVAAKEAEKERKRLEKENKAIEKEREAAIAKVNTLRTDKKNSRREMIVDFPTGVDARLVEHTKVHLGSVEIGNSEWDSPIANVVRWRRQADCVWSEDEGCFMPIKLFIQKEKHVMVVIRGEEFVKLVNGEEGKDLVCHVLKMKGKFEDIETMTSGGKNIIYLIEGLTAYLKKFRNAKNRRFAEAVRTQLEQEEEVQGNARSKRKGKGRADEAEDVDEDKVEDALLSLQVIHGVLVHHTGSLAETAQWITAFTQHIATAPYRHAQDSLSQNFCMKSGQVKSGTSPADTFIKMLQETTRLTAPIAHSIAAEYPSATQLIDAFELATEKEELFRERGMLLPEKNRASALLGGLRKESRADGAVSGRAVGPALSRRLYKVWMGREEGSTDV